MKPGYRAVIGLEIHAQLASASKIFCADEVDFGGLPNTRVSPVSLGHPGVLPTLNHRCVDMAITMGLATHCQIASRCHFARKNYFYPDLPKGFQISQDNTPICTEGYVNIRLKDGTGRRIRIQRIHMEEDSGKSLHDQDLYNTLVDLNRASTGLIEIVSHPDMSTPEEAAAYVNEIRKIVRYLRICDGNMEEGSLRVDVNVSVMREEATQYGTRVEIKNMNSISNVARAIAYEIDRQIETVEGGGQIFQETRTWDPSEGRTLVMREKESSDDYRYFPEPDLLPLEVTEEQLNHLRETIPALPEALFAHYTAELNLPEHDAIILTEQRELAEFFEAIIEVAPNPRAAANWINTIIKGYLNEQALDITAFGLRPETIGEVILLVDAGEVSHTVAKDSLFRLLLEHPDEHPLELARKHNLLLVKDTSEVETLLEALLQEYPDKVQQYRAGKKGLLGFFVGQIMRQCTAKPDPKVVNQLVTEKMEAAG